MNEPAALSAAASAAEGEGEGAADEHLLEHEPGQVHGVGGQRHALGDDGREPDGQRHGDDPAHAGGDQLGAEQRREHEERAHAREDEDEGGDVLLAEARPMRSATVIRRGVGIRDQRSVV